MKHMGWRKGVNNMYHTTRNAIGKKLEVGIRSTDKMMSNINIAFYFHQSLTQMFLFMLLRTYHSTSLRSRMFFIPKLKEFQFFLLYKDKSRNWSRIKTP